MTSHNLSLLVVSLLFASAVGAAEKPADPKATYPLKTCVVSGESLEEGGMGGPVDYVCKQADQPDRLVRFCCKGCIKDFMKDPAKYLKKIDDASAAPTEPMPAGHHHP